MPFISYADGALMTKDGDISVILGLGLPEIYTLDQEGYSQMHSLWCRAIGTLPENTIVHKQDCYFKREYRSRTEDGMSQLERKYELHFNEREYLDHKCILAITLCTAQRLRGESNYSTLCRRNIVPTDIDQERVIHFLDSVQNFCSMLSSIGMVEVYRLDEGEILGTADQCGVIERYMSLGFGESGNVLRDIEFRSDGVYVGERKLIFYTIPSAELLPASTTACSPVRRFSTDTSDIYLSFASPLGICCPCGHIYNQYIFIGQSERTLQRMEALLKNMRSLSGYSRSNRVNAEFLEDFLDLCRTTGERVIKAHYSLMAWAENAKEERAVRNRLISAAGAIGASVHEDTLDAPMLYWAGIPGNAADFPSEESFYTFTPQAASMLAGETVYLDSRAAFGIKLSDRESGRPLMVDLSELPMKRGEITNRNKFVIGPSGSGKSFFMNHLLRSYYDQGAHIVLIDIGNSYEGLCRMVQCESEGKHGRYNTYSDKVPMAFNPFKDPTDDDETINNIKVLLLKLWKNDTDRLSMLEENFLGEMVSHYMKNVADGLGSFNRFYDMIGEYDGDQVAIAKDFLQVMKPYYKRGRYGYLLNVETGTDLLQNRLVIYEIDAIKDNPILMTVTSIIIMELFISKMKRLKGVRKVLVIEEAWRALATERMAAYIKYLYKTVRKHFGEAIIVTQEIDDVLSSPVVRESIVNNSDCKILMDQSKYTNRFSELQKALGLSDRQKAEILSINRAKNPDRPFYREVWIGLGSSLSKVYSLEVSAEEYYTYTTEEPEKKKVQELATQTGDYGRAVEILAEERK